ncbi:peptidase domain-containing ABC transporter [Gemmatimonadota bacterium]
MRSLACRVFECVRRLWTPRYPTVRQYDRTDCGAASLLSVLRFHGGDASLVTVRELTHTGVQGTSMWLLREAAQQLGFNATGASGSYDDLKNAALPCIAHLVLEDGRPHFVVVFRITEKGVLIGDPARGLRSTSKEDFCRDWKSQAVLLLTPTEELHRTPAPHWVSWVSGYFRREEVWLTQALSIGFLYSGLGLLTALFVRALIDRFIPSGNVDSIIAVGAGLLALQFVRGLVGYLRSWLLIELSRRVNTRMTVEALGHLFRLPTSFFESRRTGDITARINDSVRIHAALLNVLGNTAIDAVLVFGSVAVLFYLAPLFGWASVTFILGMAVVVGIAARRVRDHQFEVKQAYAGVQASYIDSIGAIEPIRGSNSAPIFGNLLGRMYEQVQQRLARLGIVQARVSVGVELAAGGIVVLSLTAGSVLVVRDVLTLGNMIAAYSLLAGVVPATARIAETHLQFQEARVTSTRLLDLLLVDPEPNTGTTPFPMSGGLFVRSGEFRWPGGDPLLKNINIDLPRGRLTALCGPSGVGKSTLIKILDRRYSLSDGKLLADEAAASDIELASYRRHVATLPESVSIINGTIGENILLGREVADTRELIDRIETLGLGRFLSRFPRGIFTLIGDDGRQISSGERQTIGLLRSLWDLPDVLLIDEGMNAVDLEIFQIFSTTVTEYAKEHAVFFVSHQPRTLLRADHVYVLEASRIVEEGAPEALLELGSAFSELISADSATVRCA